MTNIPPNAWKLFAALSAFQKDYAVIGGTATVFHLEVGNGEVRIKYCSAEDLQRITEMIEGPRDDLDSLMSARRGDIGEARFL